MGKVLDVEEIYKCFNIFKIAFNSKTKCERFNGLIAKV